MTSYEQIFENNREWVREKLSLDPEYFEKLSRGQAPHYLFIGCSDSRMPLNTFTKTSPGEIFIHRNVANIVSERDENFLAVLQYAVENLKIPHLVICGHYDCGGVKAVYFDQAEGHVKRWLRPLFKVYRQYRHELEQLSSERERYDRLAELNVIEGVKRLAQNPIVRRARERGQEIHIHGWIIDIYHGLIRDLEVSSL